MNRRNFALSWGRKLIFGISWPLSVLIGLIFLRSFILPETLSDFIYFGTTLIGHYGILNALLYFLLYCPVILLMPSYYISRFWSLTLILTFNLFLLLDALSFIHYQEHIYSYLRHLYLASGTEYLIGPSSGLAFVVLGLIVLGLVIWIRGEQLWRSMKARFSNPMKNGSLVLAILLLILGRTVFYFGNVNPLLANIFSLNPHFLKTTNSLRMDTKRLFYPQQDLSCSEKKTPNLVLIVLDEWDHSELNNEELTGIIHLKKHGMSFQSHATAGIDVESGHFALMYSIPYSYQSSLRDIQPVIYQEFKRRKYEIIEIEDNSNDATTQFNQWLVNKALHKDTPYFLSVHLKQRSLDAQLIILDMILNLQKNDLLKSTHIMITGASSPSGKTPLIYMNAERKSGEFTHMTSHYDVMPTLMEKIWNCKKVFNSAGVGLPLEQIAREWLLITIKDGFKIIDYQKAGIVEVKGGIISGNGNELLIFPALELMTKYNRPN